MNGNNAVISILTIEDDPIVRHGIAAYLENAGEYTILQAEDGKEGLEIFRRHSPDLVLTDLRLPKMDGLEVLSSIREESPNTPVIIVSGMGTLDDAVRALKLGARDYVTKPIADMVLIKYAVDHALEHARLLEENLQYQSFLEEDVERKTVKLKQAQKLEAIGTLAGGIAHDFNNLLAVIMGFSDLALLKIKNGNNAVNDLRQIKKASIRAKDLVLQILTFSRQSDKDRSPLQVSLIILEALKLLRATLPTTVELKQNISAKHTIIKADPTEMYQVITNLCTNAFHALKNEQGEIAVELEEYSLTKEQLKENDVNLVAGNYLRLVVRDNGCGMDKTTINKIFSPTFTTKKEGKGTGLGLSLVHDIVKESKGVIQVKSSVGKGTTFTIFFPVTHLKIHNERIKIDTSLPRGSENILFVDDEESLRLLAEQVLSYLGYNVHCCSSGLEALEKISKGNRAYDLVITDQSMPQIPGTEFARELQKSCPGVPILLTTGYSSLVDAEKARAIGIEKFLLKPLSINEMAFEIRNILDQRRNRDTKL